MATVASRLLRAARNASLASRTAAAAASRAAAAASRSARVAAAAAAAARAAPRVSPLMKSCPTRGHASTMPHDDLRRPSDDDDYEHVPDDAKTPTDKDLESDEAVWALYERWCKAFNKERDHAEMARRFKIFRYYARHVHEWNTYLPEDPKKAAIHLKKRRRAKLLLSKGKDVSKFDERHRPMELGRFADGGDPLRECSKRLLKEIEEMEQVRNVEETL